MERAERARLRVGVRGAGGRARRSSVERAAERCCRPCRTEDMRSTPLFAAPLFDNARIRISDLRLPAKATTTFQHRFPSVRWQVDPGVHSLGNGPSTPVADKAVSFMEAGTTWACRNDGDAESRQIVFEIKQPPSHTEEEAAALLARAKFSTDVGTELLFENRLCRVWDFCNSSPFEPKTYHQSVDRLTPCSGRVLFQTCHRAAETRATSTTTASTTVLSTWRQAGRSARTALI